MEVSKPVLMLIDDEPVILNSLAAILRSDYGIRPFTSGEKALSFLAGQTVDLILLDYVMPGMTGFEVLAALQKNPVTREIPIIMFTGSSSSESEVEALELGASDYITKPIRPRLLLTRVKLQLELQRHRKQLEALVAQRTRSLNDAYNKLKDREEVTLGMLAKATDLRDHNTGGHIERTTEFVRVIVEELIKNPVPEYTLSDIEADDIIRSSKLHDLGKIAMPDSVLLKPGRLTEEEFKIVKLHTVTGENFLSDFVREMDDSFLVTARDIAYSHHEKWDGSGYPLGLCGDKIPLSARIAAIADVYDALTSPRPYKESFSHEQAVRIIKDSSGSHFDPYLVKVFEKHANEFRHISTRIGMEEGENLDAI